MDDNIARLESESSVGDRYKTVYDEVFSPYFTGTREKLVNAFGTCNDDSELRKINIAFKVLNKIDEHLKNYIETGNLAKFELENLNDD